MKPTWLILLTFPVLSLISQNTNNNKFRQLYDLLPTPNIYRTASGAPGHGYYQQQADYKIHVTLNEEKHEIKGEETITYTNNSPDVLDYLWVQLDQNVREKEALGRQARNNRIDEKESFRTMQHLIDPFNGGFTISKVAYTNNEAIPYKINYTMMRIDLKTPLQPKQKVSFKINWSYIINNRLKYGGRSGYEYFEEDDNTLYTIAQFFPRMAVYNEVEGWQNKQFLGSGEFTLPFGNYEVNITVPSDHIVSGTGTLSNASSVLSSKQYSRYKNSFKSHEKPLLIVTQDEAEENEKKKSDKTKTWSFKADNVRDFAFATSRKFIWDAMGVKINGKNVLAQSFYPKEGNPLWEQYSTKSVAHTLKCYSKYTIDYPYPQATSVHSKWIGMEYPMICFNGGRPEKDGTYSKREKYSMISVIIHEVGHNFFPMIINSDERQWTWMDEGLNTFVQFLTEQEWERNYPSRRGHAAGITDYMRQPKRNMVPIMSNSGSLLQFGNNAYGKPATALNILRETVMGRELFDFSFKTYCERWKFKHPSPADFFRTMEDASAVDLDWFWRGWFYTTDNVDISLDKVRWLKMDTKNPVVEYPIKKSAYETKKEKSISTIRNYSSIKETYAEKDPSLNDFYNSYDRYKVTTDEKEAYDKFLKNLDEDEKELLAKDVNFYELNFTNIGGLVSPIVLSFTFEDGSKEMKRFPAEIWQKNNERCVKTVVFDKEVVSIELDPYLESADTQRNNNYWPQRSEPTRFELYKRKKMDSENPMQKDKRLKKASDEKED